MSIRILTIKSKEYIGPRASRELMAADWSSFDSCSSQFVKREPISGMTVMEVLTLSICTSRARVLLVTRD